jgi:hypothetical protein
MASPAPFSWVAHCGESQLLRWLHTPPDDLRRRQRTGTAMGPARDRRVGGGGGVNDGNDGGDGLRLDQRQEICNSTPGLFHAAVARALYGCEQPPQQQSQLGVGGFGKRRRTNEAGFKPQPPYRTCCLQARPASTRRFARLTSGCDVLDRALGGGGVPCGMVTEIVGAASCGKTQVCRRNRPPQPLPPLPRLRYRRSR